MKKYWVQISIILVTLGVSACFKAPIFLDTPVIKFKSLRYIDHPDNTAGARDSLILRFDFEDGDGDIGLNDAHTFYPYHPYDSVVDSRGMIVRYGDDSVEPPFYLQDPRGNTTFFSDTDNRPPFNVCDYTLVDLKNTGKKDTIFKKENKFNRNFYIDFYRKRGGEYSRINFSQVFGDDKCEYLNWNSRIPIFSDEQSGSSLSGTINYYLKGLVWEQALSTDTFKVQFYIYDRALNKSNVVESPDMTLLGITKKR